MSDGFEYYCIETLQAADRSHENLCDCAQFLQREGFDALMDQLPALKAVPCVSITPNQPKGD